MGEEEDGFLGLMDGSTRNCDILLLLEDMTGEEDRVEIGDLYCPSFAAVLVGAVVKFTFTRRSWCNDGQLYKNPDYVRFIHELGALNKIAA